MDGQSLKPKVWDESLLRWLTGRGKGSELLISDDDVVLGRFLISNTLVPQNRDFPFQRFSSPNYPQIYNVLRTENEQKPKFQAWRKTVRKEERKTFAKHKEIEIAEKCTTNLSID